VRYWGIDSPQTGGIRQGKMGFYQQLAALNELKQYILQKTFTGELSANTLKTARKKYSMITLENLEKWLNAPAEIEQLEFKEAKQQFDSTKLLKYCVALANEGGGHIILGVTDKRPRQIVGSQAWSTAAELNSIKSRIVSELRFRVEVTELQHEKGRVLVFEVPPRPVGRALDYEGAYLMRAGEELRPMTPDMLKRIFAEEKCFNANRDK
jgi:predicted HTH transcriptional regulator